MIQLPFGWRLIRNNEPDTDKVSEAAAKAVKSYKFESNKYRIMAISFYVKGWFAAYKICTGWERK